MSQSSGTNLEPNVAGLLCYVLGWITGLVFFLIEKDDDFVRFHAVQSMIVFGFFSVLWVLGWIFWFVPVLSWVIWAIIWIGSLICWVLLMIKAYQGERFKMPVAGNLAEKWS